MTFIVRALGDCALEVYLVKADDKHAAVRMVRDQLGRSYGCDCTFDTLEANEVTEYLKDAPIGFVAGYIE